jgi:uncharacterized protein YegP (UPF0339 family)
MGKFEIRKGRTGAFRFVLIAKNGEVLATSENYTTKAKCHKGINAVIDLLLGLPTALPPIVDTTIKK